MTRACARLILKLSLQYDSYSDASCGKSMEFEAMTSKIVATDKRVRGRPKRFDRESAVKSAMKMFWERGYDGSTFDDLTGIMGINASSFRNTFKTKEALYREATDVYVTDASNWFANVLSDEPDVEKCFARLFDEAAELFTRADLPAGCMISLAATHIPPSQSPLKQLMSGHRTSAEAAMAHRLRQGQQDLQIAQDINVEATAAFFNALFRGMAVQARDGSTRERLREIAKVAMGAFPRSTS